MTQIEKLVERLRRAKGDVPYADVRRLLEHDGWSLAHQTGSHVTFDRTGSPVINFPLVSGRKVKRTYVKTILERLGYKKDP